MNMPAPATTLEPAEDWSATLADASNEAVRAWLSEPGLLTARLQARCADCAGLVVVGQQATELSPAHCALLDASSMAGHVREVELTCGGDAWIFAQTLIPEATMARHPWLAALGDSALGARLADVPGIQRGLLEFSRLQPGHALFERAARNCAIRPKHLWARRSWFAMNGDRLLVQEVFLPSSLS